ncbi:hypothetical protein ACPWT1_18390 [Ramlibacter sp. MMS24-I3-19]|uniref:hypothetical protein n=1 Tax=Ramlibacter sp. MMS24-I3-19 TaxID=3416606 RepID=UPI003D061494
MQQPDIEEWRLAERAAAEAEQAARAAAGTEDHRDLVAAAKRQRANADRLWREFLGSSLTPLAPAAPEAPATGPAPARDQADVATLTRRIEEWRRAQARAHAAEVKAVHAYTRFARGAEEEAPYAWQAEATMLRDESAARLQRVYEEAARLRAASGGNPLPPRQA